jgi:hypothetical protein
MDYTGNDQKLMNKGNGRVSIMKKEEKTTED